MAALGWLLNLGFAGSEAAATTPTPLVRSWVTTLEDDLVNVFFTTSDEAFTVAMTPTGGTAVRCVFTDHSVLGDERHGPFCWINQADLGTIDTNTNVEIDSRSFRVAGVRPSYGAVELILELNE